VRWDTRQAGAGSPLTRKAAWVASNCVQGVGEVIKRYWLWLLLALGFGLLTFVLTAQGMVLGPRDGPYYLSTAENLASGDGYMASFGDPGHEIDSEPVTRVAHFPPLYPLALSWGIQAGFTALGAARLLTVALVAVVVLAVALWSRSEGLGQGWSALAAALAGLMVLSHSLTPASEPPYMLALLVVLFGTSRFLRTRSWWWLASASLVAGISVGIRYIGLAAAATVVVAALIPKDTAIVRIGRSAAALAIALVPVAAVRWVLSADDPRILGWYPFEAIDLKVLSFAATGYIVSFLANPTLRLVAATLAVAGVAFAVVRGEGHLRPWPAYAGLAGLISAIMHTGALAASRLFFDIQNRFTDRLMLPIVFSLLMACIEVGASARNLGSRRGRRLAVALGVTAALATISAGWTVLTLSRSTDETVFTFTEVAATESPAALQAIEYQGQVLSNAPDWLWAAGRPGVFSIPALWDPLSRRPNNELTIESQQVGELVSNGALVLYYRPYKRDYLMSEEEIRRLAPCELAEDEFMVLLAAESSCSP
jgi:hypothetical protein